MPIDHFTREQFESYLPVGKINGEQLWKPLGIISREYCYLVPVSPYIGILVRSSVGTAGMSARAGQDSIRLYIVRSDTLTPYGSKLSKWTTRLPGWPERMLTILRSLWLMARKAGPCLRCNTGFCGIYRTKIGGGIFLKCDHCMNFEWVKMKAESSSARTIISTTAP